MKKLLILFYVILIGGCSNSISKVQPININEITVTGWGMTPDESLKNSFQSAVETALGAIVNSKTVIENYKEVQNKIIRMSYGYIASYKVLSLEQQKDGLYITKISAKVRALNLKNDILNIEKNNEIKGNQTYAEALSKRVAKKNAVDMYREIFKNYPTNLLIFEKINKLEIIDNDFTSEYVKVKLKVIFNINSLYERFFDLSKYFTVPQNRSLPYFSPRYSEENLFSIKSAERLVFKDNYSKYVPVGGTVVRINGEELSCGFGEKIREKKKKTNQCLRFKGESVKNIKNYMDKGFYKEIVATEKRELSDSKRFLALHDKKGYEVFRVKVNKIPFFRRAYAGSGVTFMNLKGSKIYEQFEFMIPLNIIKDIHSVSVMYKK